jgi:hypothetical protein
MMVPTFGGLANIDPSTSRITTANRQWSGRSHCSLHRSRRWWLFPVSCPESLGCAARWCPHTSAYLKERTHICNFFKFSVFCSALVYEHLQRQRPEWRLKYDLENLPACSWLVYGHFHSLGNNFHITPNR